MPNIAVLVLISSKIYCTFLYQSIPAPTSIIQIYA